MTLRAYPRYRRSGVEWLGDVPAHWTITQIKRFCERITDGAHISPETEGGTYPFVSTKDLLDNGNIDFHGCLRTSPASYEYLRRTGCRPYKGDVLFSKDGTIGRTVVVRDNVEFVVASSLVIVTPKAAVLDSNYLNFLLKSSAVALQVEAFVKGAGLPRLSIQNLLRVVGLVPPLAEQVAIAEFLDRETGKIDALIAEQEKLIILLAEKRQATISHTVTRGLNPDAPMKDPGVEWLGEVPAHWAVRRVKDVARLESGHTPSKQFSEYWENCTIPWVSLNDSKHLAAHDYISDTAVKINEVGLANSSARMLPAGAVVFTRDATIGLAAITTAPMAVSQHLIAWCPSDRISSLFLLRVFNAMKPYLDSYTFGATIKTIGMADVKKLVTTVPPVQEQEEIVAFIESEITKLNTLAAEAERVIALLKERRSALITAAVTGKIDVRGAAARPQPEEVALAA